MTTHVTDRFGRPRRRAGLGRAVLEAVAAVIVLFLIFPILVVIPVSFSSSPYLRFPPPGFSLQWYERFFQRGDWVDAAILSIWVGAVVMMLATILGTAASIGLVRGSFPGKRVIHAVILSPLIVPGIIVAIGIYFFYARIALVGSPLAIIAAHTALAVPYVVVNVSAILYNFDERLEHAALSLGATRWQVFRLVTLPIIRPGIIAGAIFAFITSFDELLIALFVSGSSAVTLPRKMWDSVRFEIDPTIASVSTLAIVTSISAFLSAEILRQRTKRASETVDDANDPASSLQTRNPAPTQ